MAVISTSNNKYLSKTDTLGANREAFNDGFYLRHLCFGSWTTAFKRLNNIIFYHLQKSTNTGRKKPVAPLQLSPFNVVHCFIAELFTCPDKHKCREGAFLGSPLSGCWTIYTSSHGCVSVGALHTTVYHNTSLVIYKENT